MKYRLFLYTFEYQKHKKMTISEQLKKARNDCGLTQWELKEKSKLSLDTINRIENGRNANPTVEVLRMLSKALNDFKFEI